MKKIALSFALLLTSILSSCSAPVTTSSPAASSQSVAPVSASNFDYYLLSLSWSPEFCFSHRDSPECAEHLGLIVHGLWPQMDSGRGPENCGIQPGPANPNALLDIMPTTYLIQHEWTTHGTCSGLTADQYFGLMRTAFTNFHAPAELQQPRRQTAVSPDELKQDIVTANQGMSANEIALVCRGRFLNEVEICVTKDGHPRPCGAVTECQTPTMLIAPIR